MHDRSIKKHQKRLSSGAATRIPYPGLSEALSRASGTLIGTSLQIQNYQDSVLSEIVPLLGKIFGHFLQKTLAFYEVK